MNVEQKRLFEQEQEDEENRLLFVSGLVAFSCCAALVGVGFILGLLVG